MSKRDFDQYYIKVYNQLTSLEDAFNDINKEVSQGMVEPERLEQMKLTIQPIKDSFQTLSYIKYLLDKPNKKTKINSYKRRNQKLMEISKGKHAEDIIRKNDDILKQL